MSEKSLTDMLARALTIEFRVAAEVAVEDPDFPGIDPVDLAALALQAIERAGYKVVPAEPTDAMLDAARVSWPWAPGMTQKQTDAAKYRAMLAAAPAATKEDAS